MSTAKIPISQLPEKYRKFAQSLDCPYKKDKNGKEIATSYEEGQKLHAKMQKKYLAKNGNLNNGAIFNNNQIEGWELDLVIAKIKADVTAEVEKLNYTGEAFWDSIFSTNTVNNKKKSEIARRMRAILGYNV